VEEHRPKALAALGRLVKVVEGNCSDWSFRSSEAGVEVQLADTPLVDIDKVRVAAKSLF
jgi:hypothetical protein